MYTKKEYPGAVELSYAHEFIRIEAWGRNALRVRIGPNANFPQGLGALEAAPTCCRFAFISLLTHRLLGLTRFTDAPHSKAPSRERYPPWFSSVPSNVTRVCEEPAGT